MIRMEKQREAYGLALAELGAENPNIVVLEADLGNSTRTVYFRDRFPERFFEMGIAEQNMASTAAGLALTGKIAFYNSFAVFATGRAFDQIRNSICVPGLNVKIGGSSCGLSDFGDGKTHQSVEDIAIMRAIPNMTVLAPVDAVETTKMVRAMAEHDGPVYIRINRNDLPVLMDDREPYHIGQMTKLRDGDDIVVFANGSLVARALEAGEQLASEGISVKVVNVSTIKPLDTQALKAHCTGMRAVVTAEEHSVVGGLGSAVAEALRNTPDLGIEFIGINDSFGCSAWNYDELLQHYGLTADAICAAIRKQLQ